jgi:hypothetical protein
MEIIPYSARNYLKTLSFKRPEQLAFFMDNFQHWHALHFVNGDESPASMIHSLSLAPDTDGVEIRVLLDVCPAISSIELSSHRFCILFGSTDAGQSASARKPDLHVTILGNADDADWTSLEQTPALSSITHLRFTADVCLKTFPWQSVPNLIRLAVPAPFQETVHVRHLMQLSKLDFIVVTVPDKELSVLDKAWWNQHGFDPKVRVAEWGPQLLDRWTAVNYSEFCEEIAKVNWFFLTRFALTKSRRTDK